MIKIMIPLPKTVKNFLSNDQAIIFSLTQILQYKLWLLIITICSLTNTLISLLIPFFTARFIDTVLVNKSTDQLKLFVTVFSIIVVLEIATGFASSIFSSKIHSLATFRLSMQIFRHLQHLPLDFFQRTNSSYLTQRVQGDVDSVVGFALGNIVAVFQSLFSLVLASILLFSVHPLWFCLFLFAGFVYVSIYCFFRKPLRVWSLHLKEAQNLYFSKFLQIIRYIKTIKIHALYEEFNSIVKRHFETLFAVLISNTKLSFWFSSSAKIAQRFFVLCVFIIGGLQVIYGSMTIGNFVAINSYFTIALGGISYFLNLGHSYQATSVAFSRIKELIDLDVDVDGERKLDGEIENITIEQVSLFLGDNNILQNISTTFEKGKVYCLTGDNGTGKTTFLYLLIGLYQPTNGKIKYNGIPLEEINRTDLRRGKIAFLEQEPILVNDTLKKNMLFGLPAGKEKLLAQWTKKFQMNDFVALRDKEGFEIDDHLSVISGGEKQKIAQVRTFLKNASLICLDEPTSALDESSVRRLIRVIKEVKEQSIIVISTRRKELLDIADQVISFNSEQT